MVTDTPLTLSTTAPGFDAGLSTRSSTSRPTMSRASSAALVSFVFTRPTTLPSRITVTASEIASTSDSLCVMITIVFPWSRMRPEDGEELVHLLRREHGGRLVEDEQLRVAVQRFQQLDALLLAHGEVFDDGVRIDGEPELGGERADATRRVRQIEGERRARLGAEHDVLRHRHRVHQHEVLMHHADAQRDGVVGVRDFPGLAVDQDLAAVGGVEAIRNPHRGGLPRAVLPTMAWIVPGSTVMLM